MQQPARPDVYNRVESFPLSSSIPLIPYLSSAVLTPTRVPSSEGGDGSQTTISQGGGGNVTGSSTGAPASHQSITQPLGELSLKDFEGAADPFEMTTLQAIDVIAELQDVLQPSSSSIPTSATPSIATSQTPSVTQSSPSPTAHLRSVQPVAPSGSPTPPTPRANRVEIAPTTSGYAPPSIGYPTAGYALPTTSSYAPPPTTIGYPPLIDIGLVGASPSQAQPKVHQVVVCVLHCLFSSLRHHHLLHDRPNHMSPSMFLLFLPETQQLLIPCPLSSDNHTLVSLFFLPCRLQVLNSDSHLLVVCLSFLPSLNHNSHHQLLHLPISSYLVSLLPLSLFFLPTLLIPSHIFLPILQTSYPATSNKMRICTAVDHIVYLTIKHLYHQK